MKHKLEFYAVATFNYLVAAIPWALALDWVTKITTLLIALAGFIFMYYRHRQDMRNKKLDEEIKRVKLENLMQEQYQLMRKNQQIQ